ncbi:potassium channel family protein [Clostridium sp. YIM B02569]|uniref:potassium channel family protein n=1 Tax=Clostridium sp. YIM B02569 TaxID=2911967 RepID=UPI001EEA88E2|nr:potassium channel family protein [Clostridium sp. YIM B02569]
MDKIIVEYIDNNENIYWINDEKISNIHEGRIYPTQISNVTTSKSVAIYRINESSEKIKIAQLACVNYELLKQKYYDGEYINLNYTYINNFEWLGTNKFYEYNESCLRDIKGISACCSFWNAESQKDKLISFMVLNIMNNGICFEYSIFNKIDLDLSNINIIGGTVSVNNSKFWSSSFSIVGINFGGNSYNESKISMDYTEFIDSTAFFSILINNPSISFLLSKMTRTKVNINNANYGIREICLTKSKLDELIIDFCKIEEIRAGECEVKSLLFRNCKLNGFCDIELKTRSELIFKECIVNSILKLDIDKNPLKISFENTINNGRVYFKKFQQLLDEILKNVEETSDINQLLMLKENFRSLGDYINEDLCYAKYRKMENELQNCNIFLKIFNYGIWGISDYGTKPLRVFISILLLVVGFSIFYYFLPFISFSNTSSFIDYLYVSGVTFFTVGYGDILPLNSITKMLVLLEAFLGVATMSYFLVVLSRKIIR